MTASNTATAIAIYKTVLSFFAGVSSVSCGAGGNVGDETTGGNTVGIVTVATTGVPVGGGGGGNVGGGGGTGTLVGGVYDPKNCSAMSYNCF